MELQSKLLDKEYIKTRLQEIPEIKRKDVSFRFHDSDRPKSISLYIELWVYGYNTEYGYKNKTIRISDHKIDTPHTQFIIDPNAELTKKKKSLFMRTLEKGVKMALERSFYKKLNNLS